MSERTAQALGHFIDKGWTREQAAGIVGNLIQESSLNPNARNGGDGTDGSDSVGVAQHNSGRARALKAYAAKNGAAWNDFATQLDFVDHELRTSEAAAGNRLKAATTVEDATAAMIGFERPQGWSVDNPRAGHGWSNRLNYARQALGLEPLAITEPTIAATAATPEPGTIGPPQIPSYRMTTPLQTEDLYVRDPGVYDVERDGPADDRGWTRPMLDAAAEQQTLSWIWDHVSDNTRYDPDFKLDSSRLDTDLKANGLDAGFYADWFTQARSEPHYQNLLASALEDRDRAAALDADGTYGTITRMASAILDPVALGAEALTVGMATPILLGAKGIQASRVAIGAATGAIGGVAATGIQATVNPRVTASDALVDGVIGAGFGAVVGKLLTNPGTRSEASEIQKIMAGPSAVPAPRQVARTVVAEAEAVPAVARAVDAPEAAAVVPDTVTVPDAPEISRAPEPSDALSKAGLTAHVEDEAFLPSGVRTDGVSIILRNPAGDGVGAIEAKLVGDDFVIFNSDLKAELQGQGLGVALYEELITAAAQRGKMLASDTEVSVQASRVYEALERRGYVVKRVSKDVETVPSKDPANVRPMLNSKDGAPIFRIDTTDLMQARLAKEPLEIVSGGKSVGAAQNPAVVMPELDDAAIRSISDKDAPKTFAGFLRMDLAGRIKASPNPPARLILGSLARDAAGNAEDVVQGYSRSEDMGRLFESWNLDLNHTYQPQLKAYLKAQRAAGARLSTEELTTQFHDQTHLFIVDRGASTADFDPAVVKLGTKIRQIHSTIRENAANPLAREGLQGRAVAGFAELEDNPHYLMRVFDAQKVESFRARLRIPTDVAHDSEMMSPTVPN